MLLPQYFVLLAPCIEFMSPLLPSLVLLASLLFFDEFPTVSGVPVAAVVPAKTLCLYLYLIMTSLLLPTSLNAVAGFPIFASIPARGGVTVGSILPVAVIVAVVLLLVSVPDVACIAAFDMAPVL